MPAYAPQVRSTVLEGEREIDAPRPVFVVGCPRSGTTLLSVLLHAQPNIAMPPETRFLMPAYDERESFGDLRDEANRRRLGERLTAKGTGFGDLRLDRATVVQAVIDAPPTLGSAMAAVWQEFARARGKPRWGEKRPAYWREMPTILRLFPTAQVVHLVRDPRSCVASLKRVPWWDRTVPDSAALWLMSNRTLDRYGDTLPADSYYRLRYEDLVNDQAGSLRGLCAFLGEDYDDDLASHTDAARDIVPGRKTWHGLVSQPVDIARIDAWRRDLTDAEIGLVEMVNRREMARHGYAPSGAGARPAVADIAESTRKVATTRAWLAKRRFEDARLRRRFPMPLAAQL